MSQQQPNANQFGEEIFVESNEQTDPSLSNYKQLDLVFISDCTSSMSSYIESAKQSISDIIKKIVISEKVDVRFGLVEYRDHIPQDKTFVTRTSDFTSDLQKMQLRVNQMAAQGGGDGPEAVADGLYQALHLKWRTEAVKIIVLIADAPPHGLEPTGDGFPSGCPCLRDPLKIARDLAESCISVYSVLCEPALGSYQFARDFFMTVARVTGGQFLPLTSAKLLPEVIIASALEELSLQQIQKVFEQEAEELTKKGQLTDEALQARMRDRMNDPSLKEAETKTVNITSIYSSGYDESNISRLTNMTTLTSKGLMVHGEKIYDEDRMSAPQAVSSSNAKFSEEQRDRCHHRAMHKHY